MKLILASASPRRRELLTQAGLEFEVQVSDADETVAPGLTPAQGAVSTAEKKAMAVFEKNRDCLVLGADTVVVTEDAVLGKPADEQDAVKMLSALSGRTHKVITGVCLVSAKGKKTFYEETGVTFYPLTEKEIRDYVATGEPMDKAGAYGIQGKGCTLVKGIEGDYFNVVGLPVSAVAREIRAISE